MAVFVVDGFQSLIGEKQSNQLISDTSHHDQDTGDSVLETRHFRLETCLLEMRNTDDTDDHDMIRDPGDNIIINNKPKLPPKPANISVKLRSRQDHSKHLHHQQIEMSGNAGIKQRADLGTLTPVTGVSDCLKYDNINNNLAANNNDANNNMMKINNTVVEQPNKSVVNINNSNNNDPVGMTKVSRIPILSSAVHGSSKGGEDKDLSAGKVYLNTDAGKDAAAACVQLKTSKHFVKTVEPAAATSPPPFKLQLQPETTELRSLTPGPRAGTPGLQSLIPRPFTPSSGHRSASLRRWSHGSSWSLSGRSTPVQRHSVDHGHQWRHSSVDHGHQWRHRPGSRRGSSAGAVSDHGFRSLQPVSPVSRIPVKQSSEVGSAFKH